MVLGKQVQVRPPCCDVLRDVGRCWFKFENGQMLQHIATRWPNAHNMLHPTMLRYVALACCDRSFGWGLTVLKLSSAEKSAESRIAKILLLFLGDF